MAKVRYLNEEPTPNNTVIDQSEVTKMEPIYAKVSGLSEIFSMSVATASKFVKEAENDEKFKHGIISLGHNLKLIKIDVFEEFLKANHNKWLG
ncbi:helix-turn-helix domain-containing protein [Staphylococcus chromogenes]|uniref:helix-turn-helix domain-containing protein n=1 Tax=Staphylococcus chromogenes TaxID=46126 RepID=UPI0028FFFF15|nr:helix-turn-helix domain-containing protein [Staphylococcus chromogenes]MDU0450674.1 helix-turn-helix domain-containing protein [Staphylococcus chromogenes]